MQYIFTDCIRHKPAGFQLLLLKICLLTNFRIGLYLPSVLLEGPFMFFFKLLHNGEFANKVPLSYKMKHKKLISAMNKNFRLEKGTKTSF